MTEASAATRRKFAIASMAVKRGDRTCLYVSLDYVPLGRFRARRLYRSAVREHIASAGPVDEVHVECPSHPNKHRRRRRQVA